jgi:hypothetical protein
MWGYGGIGRRSGFKIRREQSHLGSSPSIPIFWRRGGMADTFDSKSNTRKGVWVRVPPSLYEKIN